MFYQAVQNVAFKWAIHLITRFTSLLLSFVYWWNFFLHESSVHEHFSLLLISFLRKGNLNVLLFDIYAHLQYIKNYNTLLKNRYLPGELNFCTTLRTCLRKYLININYIKLFCYYLDFFKQSDIILVFISQSIYPGDVFSIFTNFLCQCQCQVTSQLIS